MVSSHLVILLLVGQLLPLCICPSTPTTICSTFCATTNCVGWEMYDCGPPVQCYTGWNWISSDGLCGFNTGTGKAVMAYSDDSGGDIYMTNDPGSSTCTQFPVSYYGDLKAGTSYSMELGVGTYLPHYAFDVYVNIILVDVNGSKWWQGGPKMYATLVSTNQTISQTMSTGGGSGGSSSGSVITSSNSWCGDNNKQDNYERLIFQSFTHNTSGDVITVSFVTNNSDTNAIWNAHEFIFVAKLCNVYCLSCFGSTINNCTSCDATQGYMLRNTTCATSCLSGYGPTPDPAVCVKCDSDCLACYGLGDNCSSCKTNNPNKGFLYDNSTTGYTMCVNPCPDGYWANSTSQAC